MTKEIPMINVQLALSIRRQVLECGGRAVAATPLSHARAAFEHLGIAARSKAVSPLRFATALQDAGAFIERSGLVIAFCLLDILWSLNIGHWTFPRS